jgi:hypothetical protein
MFIFSDLEPSHHLSFEIRGVVGPWFLRRFATSLGRLVLDSGTKWAVLFGVESTEVTHMVRTLSGSMSTGTVHTKLMIEGKTIWIGDAIAAPRQAKESGDGLMPVSLFKAVYVSNTDGYIVFN